MIHALCAAALLAAASPATDGAPDAGAPSSLRAGGDGGPPGSRGDDGDTAAMGGSTTGPTIGSPAAADALADALWERAEAAEARGAADPAAADEAATAFETTAAFAQDPAPALLRAARMRRSAAEVLSARAAVQRGGAASSALDASARQAQSCADDARRAWRRAFPDAAAATQAGKSLGAALALVGPGGGEALYLEALCTSLWARAQGVTPLLERHAEVRATLVRAAALAPAIDESGPDRELGRLLASLPGYAGGDVETARTYFERAMRAAPSPRTRIAYAESVAVKVQDRRLFESLLLPLAPESEKGPLAEKARALLQRADELFGKAH